MDIPLLQPKQFVETPSAMEWKASEQDALAYSRWLATHHYENFHVVSFLLPKALHQDFYNIYAFCRWADDLGDEIGDVAESQRLLRWWRLSLEAMYAGQATHPVFVALRATVDRRQIPPQPFHDLISAFEQDQVKTTYADQVELEDYCRKSANPVGHLVLYLCGYRDAERQRMSDGTCTGLQLANFWQDVSVDLKKDRVYMPLDAMARHGYGVEQLRSGVENAAFVATMRELVTMAHAYFAIGAPLAGTVDRRLAIDLDLFHKGGLLVLDKIKGQQYRVLHRRPSVGKAERVWLLLRALLRMPFAKTA